METKSYIKDRMLKAASTAWGYSDKIRESDFDPLLALLMEVYAAELEKISHEIGMSRERVLHKMVQLMAPDVFTAPVPASAILHAQSLDERLTLEEKEQFLLTHPQEKTELWFSPAGDFTATDNHVQYMFAGQRLFRYTAPGDRETWSVLTSSLPPNTIWLGLTGSTMALEGAQFYFELLDTTAAPIFYHHLAETNWSCGEEQLHIAAGYNQPDKYSNELAQWLRAPHNMSQNATRLTREIYRHHFLHLTTAPPNRETTLPAALAAALTPALIPAIAGEPMIWLKVVFPENIQDTQLMNLHCQVNCFPVLNRQLHELTHRLQEWINIIPLRCQHGRQFLDLHSVIDQDRNSLLDDESDPHRSAEKAEAEALKSTKPKILLRKGGTARLDERDAKAATENLLQLLRDENAAFSLYNRDLLATELKHVQQAINRLNQEMERLPIGSDPVPYLEVTALQDIVNRHLLIEYWSTQGAGANLIRNGTPLMAYKNGGLRQTGICLMTTTYGGRNRLAPHESTPAYKSAVLSKDRIMSAEDIRLFCLRETGAIVRSVEVKKGVMIAKSRQAGYVKTIDVFIRLHENHFDNLQQTGSLDHWQQTLQTRLAERSMAFLPFRVFFTAA